MNKPSETLGWVSKRTGRTAEIKQERTKVTHVDWNTVQLLFEVADNNANGVHSLIQFTDALIAELESTFIAIGNRIAGTEARLGTLEQMSPVYMSAVAPTNTDPTVLWVQLLD